MSNRAGKDQRYQWTLAIEKYQKINDANAQILVCELHFDPKSITRRKDRNILTKGTIPTLFPDLQRYVFFEDFCSWLKSYIRSNILSKYVNQRQPISEADNYTEADNHNEADNHTECHARMNQYVASIR